MKVLLGIIFLVVDIFPFITINISCQSLLACRVSAERVAYSIMQVPLYIICCFSLGAFDSLSLFLIFVILITLCLSVVLLGLIPFGALCAS